MDVLEAIRQRRSVRKFSDRPVEPEKLHTVLDAARWAPSWANMQCWRFVVVQSQATKAALSELSSVDSFFSAKGYRSNPSQFALREAPVVIVVCTIPNHSGDLRGQQYYMTDAGLAIENLMLAARGLDLGCGFVSIFDGQQVANLLEIPAYISIVGMVTLGYSRENEQPGPGRKALDEIVYAEKWQQPCPQITYADSDPLS